VNEPSGFATVTESVVTELSIWTGECCRTAARTAVASSGADVIFGVPADDAAFDGAELGVSAPATTPVATIATEAIPINTRNVFGRDEFTLSFTISPSAQARGQSSSPTSGET